MAEIPSVELHGVEKRFGDFVAVHATDLAIDEGSFVTLLGPSGCGKTTNLRMIAGLIEPSAGDILIRGTRVNDVPIHHRNLGLVFQNYALFPHKTIFDNVAFGLRYRDVPRQELRRRVDEALELVQLPHLADRYPAQLSGGQQQRIALARAVVIRPDVLLLDEPLSALDANLREDMRVELKRIQHQLGITTVFVTHDQSEALAMSDVIVVMNEGRIEQVGAPQDVYNEPASLFVARFLGNANIFSGVLEQGPAVRVDGLGVIRVDPDRLDGRDVGDTVQLVVRSENVMVAPAGHGGDGDATVLDGVVDAVDYQGQAARYFVTSRATTLQAYNPIDRAPFPECEPVSLRIRRRDCILLDAGS
jgi:putative spermidine/putrescine transport system ATP-binding protein/spermidine/putrescine transport system ATP-binding protein